MSRPLRLLALAVLAAGVARGEPRLGPPLPGVPMSPAATAAAEPDLSPVLPSEPTRDWYAAQPRVDRPLTREEAVALALRHNPALAAAQQDVAMAVELLNLARARLAPMLSTTTWASYGDGPMVVSGSDSVFPRASRRLPNGLSWDTNFMFMYPLYTGGRLENQVEARRQETKASQAELEAMRLEVAFMASTLYRRIVLQQAVVEIQRDLVATHEERLRIDQAALREGKIPQFYVYRDQAALAEARQAETNAERDVRVMTAELRPVLGIHPLSDLQTAEPLVEERWQGTREAALDEAVRQRPELAAVRARILAARHEERAANGAYQPEVGLFGMADLFADRMGERWEEYMAGVAVSLPLLDGGMRRAEVRRARAQQGRLTAREVELALRVAQQVVTADEERLAAVQNLDTAEAVLTSAREDYRIAQVRYQDQKGLNVEVLDALAAQTRAETNYVAALYEVGVALDSLRRATADSALFPATEPATDDGR